LRGRLRGVGVVSGASFDCGGCGSAVSCDLVWG
jgi:hypothetical protein